MMLQANDPKRARTIPVSEWINAQGALAFLGNLAERGFEVLAAEPVETASTPVGPEAPRRPAVEA